MLLRGRLAWHQDYVIEKSHSLGLISSIEIIAGFGKIKFYQWRPLQFFVSLFLCFLFFLFLCFFFCLFFCYSYAVRDIYFYVDRVCLLYFESFKDIKFHIFESLTSDVSYDFCFNFQLPSQTRGLSGQNALTLAELERDTRSGRKRKKCAAGSLVQMTNSWTGLSSARWKRTETARYGLLLGVHGIGKVIVSQMWQKKLFHIKRASYSMIISPGGFEFSSSMVYWFEIFFKLFQGVLICFFLTVVELLFF